MAEAQSTDDSVEISPQVEAQAKEMGWLPEADFKGDPEKWVNAQIFLDRGEHVLPIVKATNRRLREDLSKTSQQINQLSDALRQSQETIKSLQDYHAGDVKRKVEEARSRLITELKAAKKDGDTDREVDLTDELTRLNTAEADVAAPDTKVVEPPKKDTPTDYTKEPTFIAWQEENEWFGKDPAMTAIAQSVAAHLRADGNRDIGKAFLDKVTEGTNKELSRLGGGRSGGGSKVEGSKGGSGGGKSTGKAYKDLPADAKTACDDFAGNLVGPNKAYKTLDEWRAKYAADFFAEV